MTGRLYGSQEALDAELSDLQEVLGDHPCELVDGDVLAPGTVGVPVDESLKRAVMKQFAALDKLPDQPRLILYQLKTGQRSVICIAKDIHNKFMFSYRDFDARPPTKRVKDTVQAALDDYLSKDD